MGSDSFYVRVNLNIEPHDEPQSLGVACDDIIHVTDTRYNGKYHWRCSVVDQHTAKPLQTGTMPNYNRFAQICKNDRILHRTHANGDYSCLFTCIEVHVVCCVQKQVSILCLYNSFGPSGFPQGAAVVAGKATKDGARAEGLQEEGGWTSLTETQ